MNLLKKFKSIYKLLLISIFATFAVASSANSIEFEGSYGSISVNQFVGEATQNDGRTDWDNLYGAGNPVFDVSEMNIGINFGKYFNSSANSRNAIEINYISGYSKDNKGKTGNTHLVNYYNDITSVDLLYLKNFSDKIEYFGSIGVGVMEIGGGQKTNGYKDVSENTHFYTVGAGLLFKVNEMFDFKLSAKKYMDTETDVLTIDRNTYTNRKFGFEDLVITTASIVYNF